MSTTEQIALEIAKRLDKRLEKEEAADAFVSDIVNASRALETILKNGLDELINRGEYRGAQLCQFRSKDQVVKVSYNNIKREATLKFFEISLGDETYQLVPALKSDALSVSYSIAGRQGLYILCEARPLRIMLAVNDFIASAFEAKDVIKLAGMLLHGK